MPVPSPPAKTAARALVGPLFVYDVVRLARHGRGTALRFIYGGALLVVLALVYAQHFPEHDLLSLSGDGWVSLRQQARFARTFANTLLLAQNVAVLILVPAYLAGAIAEEKEKKTLELLFTTALSDREIVVGKMLGRLVHVGGVLLVGLPVLSLVQLWGGVDVTILLANFTVTALTLLSVGGVSLIFSVTAKTALTALVGAYAASTVLGLGCLCSPGDFAFSPLSFPVVLNDRIRAESSGPGAPAALPANPTRIAVPMVTYYAIVHGGIGLLAVLFAVALLRPTEPLLRPAEPPPLAEISPRPPPEAILLPEPAGSHRPSPPVGDDPLLWKEVLHGSGRVPPRLSHELAMPGVVVAVVAGIAWVMVILRWLGDRGGRPLGEVIAEIAGVMNVLLRVGVAILLTIACAGIGFRAAGSVVRERARHTLDGLLTLPLSQEAILRAKWLGSVLRMRHLLYLAAAGWLVGICTGALHPLALPLLVLTVAAQLAFVASLGLWVSVSARSIPWAHVVIAVLLLLFFSGGWLIWLYTEPPPADLVGPEPADLVLIGFTPWRIWWALTFPLFGSEPVAGATGVEAGLLAVGAVAYSLAAVALWRMAVRRFKDKQDRAS